MTTDFNTCSRCRFFRDDDNTCHFDPPVRLPRQFAAAATPENRIRDESIEWGWPSVHDHDWCGKWRVAE